MPTEEETAAIRLAALQEALAVCDEDGYDCGCHSAVQELIEPTTMTWTPAAALGFTARDLQWIGLEESVNPMPIANVKLVGLSDEILKDKP